MRSTLRFAFRRLLKSPSFAIVSILMLALGIAMSTCAFSITNMALLRGMPFPEADRLVRVFTTTAESPALPLSAGDAMELRETLRDIGRFALFSPNLQNVTLPGEPPEQRFGYSASADILEILKVQPILGRGFQPDEDQPGKTPVVVLCHAFWRERFGADPGVLGKVVRVGTTDSTVIGVLPPSFNEPLLWRNCQFISVMTVWPAWTDSRADKWISVLGRLEADASLRGAQARLGVLAEQLRQRYPTEMGSNRLRVVDLATSFATPQIRTMYGLVLGLAVFVLLIACANLGGVQLARTLGRRGELAVRTALGATRGNLVAALAADGLLIAILGTGAGVLLTYGCHRAFQVFLAWELELDLRVLLFATGSGLMAALCFSIIPAWLSTQSDVASVVKESARSSTPGSSQQRVKLALIVVQLGMALVLVSAALSFSLGVRTFLQRDRGWQPDGLVAGTFNIPWTRMTSEGTNPRLAAEMKEALGSVPGVQEATLVAHAPLFGYQDQRPITVEGAAAAPGQERQAFVVGVEAEAFRLLQIPLREGRLFPSDYRRGGPKPVVISESAARRLWPSESAIGKRVRIATETDWNEVVGIVADVDFAPGFDVPPTDMHLFRPVQETPAPWYTFVLKTTLPAGSLETTLRKALARVEADAMLVQYGDVTTVLRAFASNRPLQVFLATFAAAGLAIALIGLYGVMNQFTVQRRREIGVRMALGADYRRILSLMLRHAAVLLVVGLVLGGAGSVAIMHVLHRSMPMLPAPGTTIQVLIAGCLGIVGLVACYFPSHRAARLNPTEVLRAE